MLKIYKMKEIFTLVFLITVSISHAQDFDKEVVSKISTDTCNCLGTEDYSEKLTEGVDALQNCMTSTMMNNMTYLKENGIDMTGNSAVASSFGESLAMELLVSCQKSVPLILEMGRMYSDDEETEPLPFIVGKITNVEKGTFPVFEITDVEGRKHKLLWLTIIDNPVLFEESLKGKKNFILEYYENELYDARIKEYRYMKVLNAVKLQ